ncbi:benzoate-CoA ligase family protein [Deinococcus aluminii]|uniref:Benzoate--CoA ligase n=1 Tax=Deinococcus aluminii TaxID=1656885 RepID=A0ABP9XFM5_9DEIO
MTDMQGTPSDPLAPPRHPPQVTPDVTPGAGTSYNASEVLYHNLDAGRGAKVAVQCEDRSLTYAELADLASRFGNALLGLGLKPGDRVLMLMHDGPAFPATFFGALRAGLVPIPVNTILPPDNYAYFLNDSGARAAVVSASLHPVLASVCANCPGLEYVLVIDGILPEGTHSLEALAAAAPATLDPAPTGPGDTAFWLYSSGSTGFPKGVVHTHKDIRCTTRNYAEGVLGIQEGDVCFTASKTFHAYGLGNGLTFPFSVGASTVYLPGRPTPAAVYAAIERFRPTLFFASPTLYTMMLADPEPHDLSSVRLCASAAEALPPEIYRRWKDRFGVDILDGIGSTEMLHIFLSNRPGMIRPGSSGLPVPGYEARIEDFDGREVPRGESGNLLIRGGSAAREYWNQPEKTAKTMRGEWMFTGDRYHQDEDGFFWYEGRSDDMFKVSGQWVSPIEVENTLLEHPAVLECAVVIGTDGDGLQRTQAFVTLQEGYAACEELSQALQSHVKGRLAPYKYPRKIHFVDELPKTSTGKIQRFRLRDAG